MAMRTFPVFPPTYGSSCWAKESMNKNGPHNGKLRYTHTIQRPKQQQCNATKKFPQQKPLLLLKSFTFG